MSERESVEELQKQTEESTNALTAVTE